MRVKIKTRRVQIALVFCVAVIKEKAIRTQGRGSVRSERK